MAGELNDCPSYALIVLMSSYVSRERYVCEAEREDRRDREDGEGEREKGQES